MPTQPDLVERRTEKLDIRLSRSAKKRLQAAASAAHCSMSDFVMGSALSRADELLIDRSVFALEADQWKAFLAALDAPVRSMPNLKALLSQPDFFQKRTGK